MDRVLLNDPILLQVVEISDLPTVLGLRQVNRSINGLIACYEPSIAKHIAENLCPIGSEVALIDHKPATLQDVTFFVQLRLAHDLAVKAVASNQVPRIGEPPFEGISSDDRLGDELRQRVGNGLMVVSELCREHNVVMGENCTVIKKRPTAGMFRFYRGPKSSRKTAEEELLRRWRKCVKSLPEEDVVDLGIALWCLRGKLTFDYRGTSNKAALWNDVMVDSEVEAIQWTVHHLIRKGLKFINDLWSENEGVAQKTKNEIDADIAGSSSKLINLQCSTSNLIMRECRREISHPPRAVYLNTSNEADCYCESTFADRISPFFHEKPPDQLHYIRHDVTLHSMMRHGCSFDSTTTKGNWRKKRK